MSKLDVRRADQKDIAVIHKLADEIWRAHYPGIISDEQIEYMLEKMYSEASLLSQMKDGHVFYLAYEEETPIGYFSYSQKDIKQFFLHKLYIKTNEHRKGFGGKLLTSMLELIPLNSEVRLTVNRKNSKAINFYFKKGFNIEEVKDFDIGDGFLMEDFVMLLHNR